MKKLILCVICLYACLFSEAEERKAIVYKVNIQEEIGPSVWRTAKRSFEEANRLGADYILVHMNTYGGMVVYADSLRSLLLNDKRPVWVFIDNNAASAGALISIACDRIYMREGANIGAATVVDQMGKAMPDKYQSYMRSMIRSTAQAQGKDTVVQGRDTLIRWKRDPWIAEAMVDERVAVPGVSDTGKILTFTPHEAMKHGYCDGIVESVEELIAKEGVARYELREYQVSSMDKVIGFLMNPALQGVLIMLIIGGIYFELQTPGVGFPLIVALSACVLYFAPLYLEGFANFLEIILFGIGAVLLLLELFVVPGFGVTGIGGILCIIGALTLAGVGDFSFEFMGEVVHDIVRSLFFVLLCVVVSLCGSIGLSYKLFSSRKLPFALQAEETVESGFVGVDMQGKTELGKEGIALTDLRPSGKVRVGNEVYDAVSLQGIFILKDSAVRVVKYQAGQIYVEKCPA